MVKISGLLLGVLASVAVGSSPAAEPPLGPVYPILEQDMLAQIMARLEADQKSGLMQAKVAQGVARAKASLEQPKAVSGITRTQEAREWLWDPTVTAQQDIKDPYSGKIAVRAGTRINPLRTTSWPGVWYFIDARDATQIEWLVGQLGRTEAPATILLTGGSPRQVGQRTGRTIYFDQSGVLTKKFGINRVPATVRQDGLALRIREAKI